jgi:hypothetical protein
MTKKVLVILVIVFTYTSVSAKCNSCKHKTLSYWVHKTQKQIKAAIIKNKYSTKRQYSLR